MTSSAARLLAGCAALTLAAVLAVLFWWMTVRTPDRPARVAVDALSSPVSVQWGADDVAVLTTSNPQDAAAAIGFIHGTERAWSAELRRRTALGLLSEWFGAGVLPIDRHTRQLGVARGAQQAYQALSDSARHRLQAYTRGMNAALASRRAQLADPFVTLDVAPGTWAPWHVLAVERLVAWLSTPPDRWRPDTTHLPAPLQTFLRRDRLLRRWLHVHGLERSTAWTVADTTPSGPPRRVLFQRHVTGTSALPFFQDIRWDRGDGVQTTLGTVPGTLLFPAGATFAAPSPDAAPHRRRSWSVLLGSPGSLSRLPVDTTAIRHRLERTTLRNGAETLAPIRRLGASPAPPAPRADDRPAPRLPFPAAPDTRRLARLDTASISPDLRRAIRSAPNPPTALARALRSDSVAADSILSPPSPVDTTWVLRWAGLEAAADTETWMQLAGLLRSPSAAPSSASPSPNSPSPNSPSPNPPSPNPPSPDSLSFQLFDGVGIEVRGANWRVLGRPSLRAPVPGGVLIGRTPWARFQADVLRGRVRSEASVSPETWSASDSSAWAAARLPDLLASLAPLTAGPPALRDAITYLRNWNAVYDRASIGATLFDRWIRAYRREIGRLPPPEQPAFFADHRRRQALVEAVDTLLARQGRDLRRWRWERVVADRRPFPVFSADSLLDQSVGSLSRTRYAPLQRPGRGHPSTLADGPTLIVDRPLGPSPSAWEAWTDPHRDGLTVRRLRFDPGAFLARPLLEERRPPPVSLSRPSPTGSTELVPPTHANR